MKTLYLLLLTLLAPLGAVCQVVFPQEPQWKVPIYFQDGTGKRDTVWFGYDPQAHRVFYQYLDTVFGEKLVPSPILHEDSSMVVGFSEDGFWSGYSKVDITNRLSTGSGGNYTWPSQIIYIYNYVCPLYFWIELEDMKAPSSIFYAPLNDEALPRFYFDLNVNSFEYFVYSYDTLNALPFPSINVMDMPTYEFYMFECEFPPFYATLDGLTFYQYDYLTSAKAETGRTRIRVWNGTLVFENPSRLADVWIVNAVGQTVYRRTHSEQSVRVETAPFAPGVYSVTAAGCRGVQTLKFFVP